MTEDQGQVQISRNDGVIDVLYALEDARATAAEIKERTLTHFIDVAIAEAKLVAERSGLAIQNISLTTH
jgi:deoxyxylulose-5-phosphate synthase